MAGALAQRTVLRYGTQVIGRRIAVYGPSGSGKTTLGRQLGELLDLPVVELDAIHHLPNWQERPVDEFRTIVRSTLDGYQDGWVSDGNYGGVREFVLGRAETVVWLRLPFRTVYSRLVRRTLSRMWTRELLWGTNRESFRMSFFSRESILLWGISHWRAHHKNFERDLARYPHTEDVRILRSSREAAMFVAGLGAEQLTRP